MILLDTHAWIWHVASPPKLSRAARRAIDGAKTLGIAAISCWEVAMLLSRGRLELDRDTLVWVHHALAIDKATLLPLTPEIAVRAAELRPGFGGDPADRLIVATALLNRAPLVTKDDRLHAFSGIRAIW